MITKFGKRFITSYLANGLNFSKKDIAIGIGSTAASVNDTDLEFEFYRSGVFLGSSDIQTNTGTGVTTYSVVYKTTLPTDVEGVIYEMGLFPSVDIKNTDYSSNYISSFENIYPWYDSSGNQPIAVTSPSPLIGSTLFSLSATSGNSKSYKLDTLFDISGYGVNDSISIAFNQRDLNLNYIFVKMYISPTAYKEIRFPAQSSIGNKILKTSMSNLFNSTYSSTDAVDFSSITTIEVGIKSASGTSNVLLDGLRINDDDSYNTQYGLISRSVLTTPIIKKLGVEMDIEYKINIGYL